MQWYCYVFFKSILLLLMLIASLSVFCLYMKQYITTIYEFFGDKNKNISMHASYLWVHTYPPFLQISLRSNLLDVVDIRKAALAPTQFVPSRHVHLLFVQQGVAVNMFYKSLGIDRVARYPGGCSSILLKRKTQFVFYFRIFE